ncbi:MAG: hypothetical protein HC780_11740 [Leptolyngbyaceae cyanobacterium CSU_1_3]|nr:hypothetical protein [Leptolyngbyaceae cyanobacterium CSU_1_3]
MPKAASFKSQQTILRYVPTDNLGGPTVAITGRRQPWHPTEYTEAFRCIGC